MGGSSLCAQCLKRLNVFSKRRKCVHCMTTVCRACYEPHVALRHPNVQNGARSSHDADQDVHFTSPRSTANGEDSDAQEMSTSDLLDDVEDVENVEVEDEDNDDEVELDRDDDDEDDGGEDLVLDAISRRRASVDEEASQYREFTQLQEAVTKYATQELEIRREHDLAEIRKRVIWTRKLVVGDIASMRKRQAGDVFVICYAVFVTLIVWTIAAVGVVSYLHIRDRVIRSRMV